MRFIKSIRFWLTCHLGLSLLLSLQHLAWFGGGLVMSILPNNEARVDAENSVFYLYPILGQVQRVCTVNWRLLDFVWIRPIMDYEERDDVNHGLWIGSAALALLFTRSRLVWLVPTLRRKINRSSSLDYGNHSMSLTAAGLVHWQMHATGVYCKVPPHHQRSHMMDSSHHSLRELFDQLGLDSDYSSIEQFISQHRLQSDMPLSKAGFWTSAQAAFLRESYTQDADWVEVIDQLNQRLR